MPKIRLNLLNIFTLQTGKKTLEYEGNTVGEVIKKFVEDYKSKLDENLLNKSKTKLSQDILILLNGKQERNSKTKLKEADQIYISYPLSGG
ncbi:MAG: MoaD/ThiS family protein [Candidatus Lokiarchaeota archaeon]